MEETAEACSGLTAADRRNLWQLQIWGGAWALCFVASVLLLRRWPELVPGTAGRVALVTLTTALGVAMVVAFARYLRDADELVRKIQLEALAIAFGAAIVIITSWRVVEKAGGPQVDSSDLLLPIILVWVVAQLLVARRYR
jgi:hypothetical protein